jgi:uncharacterized membrane protein
VAERLFVGTHFILHLVDDRLWGYPAHALKYTAGAANWIITPIGNDAITAPVNLWRFFNPAGFFSSPETWIGVAAGVALIAAAIQLRRRRSEI